ncbi:MAG: TonB-dependent receptor, partial [Bacteroidia bacterium]
MIKRLIILALVGISALSAIAQNATLRGFVYNEDNGEPLVSALVTFKSIKQGAYSDEGGLYAIPSIPAGKYTVVVTLVGHDTATADVELSEGQVVAQNFYLNTTSNALGTVKVSAEKIRKSKEINISKTTIKPVQLTRIPSVGGEPDLVQYLQVLPGVVFSGDQGGQLYIRGGSPIMNRVMLDGLTIYNPFHSIGLFSVFDSDILKSVDVYSAGFNSEYGGRISAIVDVKTRDGNKKRLAGKINASPFSSKFLIEGPLKKYEPEKGSSSFIVSYKNSYLNRTAPIVYPYAANGNLPYSFSDLYSKISFNSAKGSNISFFGFDYTDNVNFEQSASYNWTSSGLGTKFLLV